MAEKKQELMYSNKDIDLIKSVFAENDELLIIVRKLFFGAELTNDEKEIVKASFANPEVVEVFRRKVYGINNLNTPVGQLSDFWLGVETQIFGASRDTIYQAIMSKELVLSMFIKAFDLLINPDGEKIDISVTTVIEADPLGIKIIARNLYMKAVETALLAVKTIAGMKQETVEEAVKRLKADSSK